MAERVGFEPTIPRGYTGFRDRRFRPLSHLSGIQKQGVFFGLGQRIGPIVPGPWQFYRLANVPLSDPILTPYVRARKIAI